MYLLTQHIACLREEILIDTEPRFRIKVLRHMKQNTASGEVRFEDVTD
jgi:hypothetical protein